MENLIFLCPESLAIKKIVLSQLHKSGQRLQYSLQNEKLTLSPGLYTL